MRGEPLLPYRGVADCAVAGFGSRVLYRPRPHIKARVCAAAEQPCVKDTLRASKPPALTTPGDSGPGKQPAAGR
jgi:hypothetical protein